MFRIFRVAVLAACLFIALVHCASSSSSKASSSSASKTSSSSSTKSSGSSSSSPASSPSGSPYPYSYFFNHTGGQLGPTANNISSTCHTALVADVPACDGYFRWIAQSDYFQPLNNASYQNSICDPSCLSGFQSYRSNLVTACSKDPQPLPGIPATYWVDATLSAFNQTCLKDSSGKFCTDVVYTYNFTDSGDLPNNQLCSPCVYNVFQHLQSTSFSNYNPGLAAEWSSIQSRCKVSFPTALPTKVTNVSLPANYASDGSGLTGCGSGNTYTVASGDGCEAIAVKHNVSFGALVAINGIYPDCSNLIGGAQICLPPTCSGYIVQSGDSCVSIANATGTTFQQLIGWNPSVNSYCDNLIAGQNICISPPGGVQNYTTIPSQTVTTTAIYATTTALVPHPLASGTNRRCGKYYAVQSGDICQLITVNYTISLPLFEAVNPSINLNCSNLLPGDYYCVKPTADYNASSSVVSPPNPTPSGTTSDCYEYYTIRSGDNCYELEQDFLITLAQLQFWNPSLKSDCSNLYFNESYCINSPDQSSASASSSTKAATKRAVVLPIATQTNVAVETGGVPYGYPLLNAPREQARLAALMNGHTEL